MIGLTLFVGVVIANFNENKVLSEAVYFMWNWLCKKPKTDITLSTLPGNAAFKTDLPILHSAGLQVRL